MFIVLKALEEMPKIIYLNFQNCNTLLTLNNFIDKFAEIFYPKIPKIIKLSTFKKKFKSICSTCSTLITSHNEISSQSKVFQRKQKKAFKHFHNLVEDKINELSYFLS